MVVSLMLDDGTKLDDIIVCGNLDNESVAIRQARAYFGKRVGDIDTLGLYPDKCSRLIVDCPVRHNGEVIWKPGRCRKTKIIHITS